ncbi:galactose oxidase [Marinicauda salina]|uniref:Galactose oxidase n=1 Tax=Marinicauda salina TaxID=2135793 RepID=A0A2U2BRM1_9PROT|nr:kelch repeat-containing protein [Marinicauda salina]PWE16628.1 galactose oxidase [Marinicauda salina]
MSLERPSRRHVTGGLIAVGAGLASATAACGAEQRAAPAAAPMTPGWRSGARLPIRVQEIYPAALDGRIWLAGGLSPDAGTGRIGISDRFFEYDPGRETWRARPRLPLPIHHPNCVGLAGRLYAIGGFTAANGGAWSMSDAVRVYDPDRNEWTGGPRMPTPWAETVAAVVGGRIHVVTGRRPAGLQNSEWPHHADTNAHLVLDPGSEAWTVAAPAPTARNSAAGAVLNGRLHVVGGRTVSGGNTPVHEAYDPETDRWETLAPLPAPEAGPRGSGGLAMAELGGRLYAFGGEWFDSTGGGVYDQVWAYDPQADAWSEAGRMPTPRHGLGAVTLDGAIHVIAGAAQPSGNGTTDIVEIFRPG